MNSSVEAGERSGQGSPAASSPLPTPAALPPRSPYLQNSQPLSSSPSSSGTGLAGAPSSPSLASSSNRFGLSLGNLVRRPRGWTTSSAQRSPGATSPGSNQGEQPPSPSGGERASNGYGFPALRRSLSKRTASNGATAATGAASGSNQNADASSSSGARARHRRSSSQPPQATSSRGATESGGDSAGAADPRPNTAGGSSRPSAANTPAAVAASATEPAVESQRLRLVPHLESSRSLHFEPIERDLAPYAIVKVGRFTDRSNHHQSQSGSSPTEPARVAFKSKVVSRGHAEIWADEAGKFFIKDTKSSSGTFLNHIRLSAPNTESRPFPLKDGDVLQLGVDYQGGTEEIYRCVKMRVELNRAWQRGANSFNTAALAQLRALGGGSSMEPTPTSGTAMTATASQPAAAASAAPAKSAASLQATAAQQQAAAAASITDCCICLYPVTVCQALFIAPCSHVTHFKCIRPLVQQNYPGFCCPLCRTYADLEADVEIDPPEVLADETPSAPPALVEPLPSGDGTGAGGSEIAQPPSMAPVEEAEEPASRAGSIRSSHRPPNSHRGSAIAIAGPDGLPPGIAVTPHRGARSRPSSRAPSIAEVSAPLTHEVDALEPDDDLREEAEEGNDRVRATNEEDSDEAEEGATGGLEDGQDGGSSEARRASPSSNSRPLAMAMPSSSSHLSPTSQAELYASLANATTPPNNTFLSTLADSSALHLTGFGGNAAMAQRSSFEVPVSGAGTALGTPMSLDAALEVVEGPGNGGVGSSGPAGVPRSSAEASRSGSGSGSEATDRELLDGEGEADDGEMERSAAALGGQNLDTAACVGTPGRPGARGTDVLVDDKGKVEVNEPASSSSSPPTAHDDLDERVKQLSLSHDDGSQRGDLST